MASPLINDLPLAGAKPVAIGDPSWERPFIDLTAELVLTRSYIQDAAYFSPLALDSIHPTLADMFLVDEGPRDGNSAPGFYKWTRTYARIPPSRQVFGSYSWLVPGISTGAVFSPQNITGSSDAAGVTTITAASSPSISVGDSCSISYTFTDSATGTQYGRNVLRTALTGTSGATIKVALISEPGGTITYITIKKVQPGRPAEALEVNSMAQLDYFLPGVSAGVATPFDIPRISALEIYDGDGLKVNVFTASTVPTITEWRASIAARENICVVSSVVRRWKGNIYERETRYCIAQ
jgi:hypothetical protein